MLRSVCWTALLLGWVLAGFAWAGTPPQLLEINMQRDYSIGCSPGDFTISGNKMFFTANSVLGRELYVTEGSSATTRLAADFFPGNNYGDGNDSNPQQITPFGGGVLCLARTSVEHFSLCFSDGTPSGSRSFGPNLAYDLYGYGEGFIASAGSFAFVLTRYSPAGGALYRTDGTSVGTELVHSFSGPLVNSLEGFSVINGLYYFSLDDGIHGAEMWASDGTDAGTRLLADINPGTHSSYPGSPVSAGGIAYFQAATNDNNTSVHIWRTDGTPGNTFAISPEAYLKGFNQVLLPLDGHLFYVAISGAGYGIYRTDGTTDTTTLIKPVGSGSVLFNWNGRIGRFDDAGDVYVMDTNGANDTLVHHFKRIYSPPAFVDNLAVFSGDDGIHQFEPWISDGTPAGTRLLANTTSESLYGSSQSFLTPLNHKLFFMSIVGTGDIEYSALWKTDGTPSGTIKVTDLVRVGFPFPPFDLQRFNQHVWFPNNNGELWSVDETTLTQVGDLGFEFEGSWAASFFQRPDGRWLFTADDGIHGAEPWITDGTPAGTRMVADIAPGARESDISSFDSSGFVRSHNPDWIQFKGLTWFAADDASHGLELWSTDGRAAHTQMLGDLNPGGGAGIVRDYNARAYTCVVQDKLLFYGNNGAVTGVFATDGMASGTKLLRQVYSVPGSNFSPTSFQSLKGKAYFIAPRNASSVGLWRTDGTPAGTNLVTSGTNLRGLCPSTDKIFYTAAARLWASNGTSGGTHIVDDLTSNTSTPLGLPFDFIPLGDHLYYRSGDNLWTSDGIPGHARSVASGASQIDRPVTWRGSLYYLGTTPADYFAIYAVNNYSTTTQLALQGTIPQRDGDYAALAVINDKLCVIVEHTAAGGYACYTTNDPATQPQLAVDEPFKGMNTAEIGGDACLFDASAEAYDLEPYFWSPELGEVFNVTVAAGDTAPTVMGLTGVTADFDSNAQAGLFSVAQFHHVFTSHRYRFYPVYWRIAGLDEHAVGAQLTFAFDPALLAPRGMDAAGLVLLNSEDGENWDPATIDLDAHQVRTAAEVRHFSYWALAVGPPNAVGDWGLYD